MQMTDEHWCKMAKKGHPSPGFEPAPLEGSKKVMNFCLKLYHWAMGASTESDLKQVQTSLVSMKRIKNQLHIPAVYWNSM